MHGLIALVLLVAAGATLLMESRCRYCGKRAVRIQNLRKRCLACGLWQDLGKR